MPKKKMEENHVKPTKEELEANAQQALKELEGKEAEFEDSPNAPVNEEGEEEDREDSEEDESNPDKELDVPAKDDRDDSDQERETVKKKALDEETLKKKLNASTREAQILYQRNKQVQDAIAEASALPAPTDDEMRKEFPDFDDLDDFSKRMARDNFTNTRRLDAVTKVSEKFKDLELWQGEIDKYADNPEILINNPELEGRLDEFKLFATKPTRRGVDPDDLVKAFLYDVEKDGLDRGTSKGRMFPEGSAGVKRDKPKSDKLSAEQAGQLRKSNYNEYVRLLKAHKIDPTILE